MCADHATLKRRAWHPLGGPCVCEHCCKLGDVDYDDPRKFTRSSRTRQRHFGFATEERALELLEDLQNAREASQPLAQVLFDNIVHPLLERVVPEEKRHQPDPWTLYCTLLDEVEVALQRCDDVDPDQGLHPGAAKALVQEYAVRREALDHFVRTLMEPT